MEKSWKYFFIAMLISGIIMILPTIYVINSIPLYVAEPNSESGLIGNQKPGWPMELYVQFLGLIVSFCTLTISLFFVLKILIKIKSNLVKKL